MQLHYSRHRLPATLGLSVLLAACGSSASSGPATTPKLSGSLTVFAAASLTEALNDYKTALSAADPGVSVTFSLAGSQQLVAQIQSGAPADVVATADEASMQKLVAAKYPRDGRRSQRGKALAKART